MEAKQADIKWNLI